MKNRKKEYIKKIEEEYEIPKDEHGKSLIEIKISKEEDILSAFSTNKPTISNELAEFLNHQLRPIVVKNGIHLNIICSSISKEKEEKYIEAIRNYYKHDLVEKNREIKRNKLLSGVMAILGTLVLTVSILFSVFEVLTILASVIDIIAWVLLWEAVDLYLFQRPKIEIEELKAYEMINAEITYSKNE